MSPKQVASAGPRIADESAAALNRVHLRGRVSGVPVATTLPSGDVVVSVRVVVDRGVHARKPPYVDTIDCSAWTTRTRRSVLTWGEGDQIDLEGALRRRFWRVKGGAQSRYEVEISSARRVSRRRVGSTPGDQSS